MNSLKTQIYIFFFFSTLTTFAKSAKNNKTTEKSKIISDQNKALDRNKGIVRQIIAAQSMHYMNNPIFFAHKSNMTKEQQAAFFQTYMKVHNPVYSAMHKMETGQVPTNILKVNPHHHSSMNDDHMGLIELDQSPLMKNLKRPGEAQHLRMHTIASDLVSGSGMEESKTERLQAMKQERKEMKEELKKVLHEVSSKTNEEVDKDLDHFKQNMGQSKRVAPLKTTTVKHEISNQEYDALMKDIEEKVRPHVGQRDFYKVYSQVAKDHDINLDDYLIKFGDAHFNSFMDHLPEFTDKGQDFVNAVGSDLQKTLIDPEHITKKVVSDPEAFKKYAFDSHVDIYVDNGLQDILLESPIQNTEALLHCYLWPVIMTEKYNSGKNAMDVAKKIIGDDLSYLEHEMEEKVEDLNFKLHADVALNNYMRHKFGQMGMEYDEFFPGWEEQFNEHQQQMKGFKQDWRRQRKDTDEDSFGREMEKNDVNKFAKEMLQMQDMYFDSIDGQRFKQNDQKIQPKDEATIQQVDDSIQSRIFQTLSHFRDNMISKMNYQNSSSQNSSNKSYDHYVVDAFGEFTTHKEIMNQESKNESPRKTSVRQEDQRRHTFLFDRGFINENGDFENYSNDSSSNSSSHRTQITAKDSSVSQDRSTTSGNGQTSASNRTVDTKSEKTSHSPASKSEKSYDYSPSGGINNWYRALI